MLYNTIVFLGYDYHRDPVEIFKAILLLPVTHLSYNPVSWTISHEILFYSFFSLLIINKRIGLFLLLIWQLTIVYFIFSSTLKDTNYLISFIFSTYNILFIFGIFAALLADKYLILFNRKIAFFIVGNLLFIFTAILDVYTHTEYNITLLLYGLSSFLIIINSTNYQLNDFFKSKKILLLLGDASFSIYLVHLLSISLISKIFIKIDIKNYISDSIIYILMAFFSVLIGVFIYKIIEEPLLNYFKNKIMNGSK